MVWLSLKRFTCVQRGVLLATSAASSDARPAPVTTSDTVTASSANPNS